MSDDEMLTHYLKRMACESWYAVELRLLLQLDTELEKRLDMHSLLEDSV